MGSPMLQMVGHGTQLLIFNLKIMRWFITLLFPLFLSNCSDAQVSSDNNPKSNEAPVQTLIIDVRSVGEYQQGTAGEAINIPVNDLEKRLNELPQNKNVKITVFCLSGGRSSHAKNILEKHGYTNVENGGTVGQMRAKLKKAESEKSKSKT